MLSFCLKCGIFQFQNGSETQETANRETNRQADVTVTLYI